GRLSRRRIDSLPSWPIPLDGRPMRRASGGARLGQALEAVTEAPHGGDLDAAAFELLAQAVHVHLDRVVTDLVAPLAEVLDDLFLADESPDALQQDLEQADLARRQLERLFIDVDGPADLVVGERTVAHPAARTAHAAAHEGPHPRFQLGEGE